MLRSVTFCLEKERRSKFWQTMSQAHYVSGVVETADGESEGKDQKGIFPASADLTTDLHSMAVYSGWKQNPV